jgi:hypothetical protein
VTLPEGDDALGARSGAFAALCEEARVEDGRRGDEGREDGDEGETVLGRARALPLVRVLEREEVRILERDPCVNLGFIRGRTDLGREENELVVELFGAAGGHAIEIADSRDVSQGDNV